MARSLDCLNAEGKSTMRKTVVFLLLVGAFILDSPALLRLVVFRREFFNKNSVPRGFQHQKPCHSLMKRVREVLLKLTFTQDCYNISNNIGVLIWN